MALEKISPATYRDTSKPVTIPRVETEKGKEAETTAINITEEPSIYRGATGHQTNTEANNGQYDGEASELQIKDALSKVNSRLKAHRTKVEFNYHEETNRVSIRVLDKETQEVIKEIPPEETLDMVQKMWEMAGILVDEKR